MSGSLDGGFPRESQIGWTCPVCENYNERENMLCNHCGFVREIDQPMDDELPDDSGPQEP